MYKILQKKKTHNTYDIKCLLISTTHIYTIFIKCFTYINLPLKCFNQIWYCIDENFLYILYWKHDKYTE